MEYLVLARKWRPQIFEDVIGQEHVVRTLKNAISLNRTAHAYIFSGPRGIGKTTVARILAKALNCADGPAEVPCNKCANCLEITEGLSMDVREIDGASNRGIDEIRELRENARFLPASSRYKIYIIDEVHMLTKEAFNALLKIIEEPPPHVLFIFATTELHKIPPTILSRCQRHDFRRVSLRDLSGHLRKIADSEGIEVSDRALAWIAEAGEGSVRDSQSIFDQAISYAGKSIKDAAVEEILGLSDRQIIHKVTAAVLARDSRTCLELIDDGYYAGMDMKQFYGLLMANFRNLLVVKLSGTGPAPVDLTDEEIEQLRKIAEDSSRETLQRLLEYLMAEEDEVRKSLNPRLNVEFTIIRMASLEPLIPIDDVIAKIEALERKLLPGMSVPPISEVRHPEPVRRHKIAQPAAAAPSPAPSNAPPSGRNAWEALKEKVKKESFPLWSKLEPGRLVSHEDGTIRVAFPKSYIFWELLRDRENKETLLKIAGEGISGIEFIEDENGGPNGRNDGKKNSYDMKREAVNQPIVQKIMGLFEGAEIREITVKNGKNDK